MDSIFIIIGICVIITLINLLGNRFLAKLDNKIRENEIYPYKVRDDFLTDAERSFYFTIKVFLGDKVTICPKVRLGDIFFPNQAGKNHLKYLSMINQKHVDFVLCESETMKAICAVELDDSSHAKEKAQKRDFFVEKVFKDAGFPLIRFPLKNGYTRTEIEEKLSEVLNAPKGQQVEGISELSNDERDLEPLCPKCQIPMVVRKSTRGEKAGTEFYGCTNYPKCKEIKDK